MNSNLDNKISLYFDDNKTLSDYAKWFVALIESIGFGKEDNTSDVEDFIATFEPANDYEFMVYYRLKDYVNNAVFGDFNTAMTDIFFTYINEK